MLQVPKLKDPSSTWKTAISPKFPFHPMKCGCWWCKWTFPQIQLKALRAAQLPESRGEGRSMCTPVGSLEPPHTPPSKWLHPTGTAPHHFYFSPFLSNSNFRRFCPGGFVGLLFYRIRAVLPQRTLPISSVSLPKLLFPARSSPHVPQNKPWIDKAG